MVWLKHYNMKNIIFLISLLLFFSCSETAQKKNNNEFVKAKDIESSSKKELTKKDIASKNEEIKVEKDKKDFEKPTKKEILPKQCNFGNIKIVVSENNGKINIKSNNEFVEEMNLDLKGKVDAFFETDVDGDGFNEFYCVSNKGDIIAFSSYKNKSFGKINLSKKPYDFYPDCYEVKFWEVKDKKLHITFSNAKDELFTVRYSLAKGESAYQLKAE